jgi:hypothetical protein
MRLSVATPVAPHAKVVRAFYGVSPAGASLRGELSRPGSGAA